MILVFPSVFSLSYNPIKSKGFPEENHKFVNFLSWFSNPQSYCSACPWTVNPLTTVILQGYTRKLRIQPYWRKART